MKLNKFIAITTILVSTAYSAYSQNQLVTYPAPQGAELMNDFSVQVREAGKDWKPVKSLLPYPAAP